MRHSNVPSGALHCRFTEHTHTRVSIPRTCHCAPLRHLDVPSVVPHYPFTGDTQCSCLLMTELHRRGTKRGTTGPTLRSMQKQCCRQNGLSYLQHKPVHRMRPCALHSVPGYAVKCTWAHPAECGGSATDMPVKVRQSCFSRSGQSTSI